MSDTSSSQNKKEKKEKKDKKEKKEKQVMADHQEKEKTKQAKRKVDEDEDEEFDVKIVGATAMTLEDIKPSKSAVKLEFSDDDDEDAGGNGEKIQDPKSLDKLTVNEEFGAKLTQRKQMSAFNKGTYFSQVTLL